MRFDRLDHRKYGIDEDADIVEIETGRQGALTTMPYDTSRVTFSGYLSDSFLTTYGGLKSPLSLMRLAACALSTYEAPSRAFMVKPWV